MPKLAEATGGMAASICRSDPDDDHEYGFGWSRLMGELAVPSMGFHRRFILKQAPIEPSLAVYVDGRFVPARSEVGAIQWTFERSSNSVNFTDLSVPSAGSKIRIEYDPACG